ncbi:hypothetical protein Bca101_043555 [Brassica carinata]
MAGTHDIALTVMSDEINYLGQLSHQNLVKLIGYCVEDEQHPLLYEFMNKGSLEDHLFTNDVQLKPLLWTLRVNVALDAAKEFPSWQPFYCYNGILSDFGLARNCPKGETGYGITRVFGTIGSPELVRSQILEKEWN